jgi:hypothetical protein
MSSEFISSESGPGMGRLAVHWESYTIATLRLALLAAVTRARKSWVALQRSSAHLNAIDPPLSRRILCEMLFTKLLRLEYETTPIHRSICFVLRVDEAVGDGP